MRAAPGGAGAGEHHPRRGRLWLPGAALPAGRGLPDGEALAGLADDWGEAPPLLLAVPTLSAPGSCKLTARRRFSCLVV